MGGQFGESDGGRRKLVAGLGEFSLNETLKRRFGEAENGQKRTLGPGLTSHAHASVHSTEHIYFVKLSFLVG